MRIRDIAYALPLVVGIACSTSRTQGPRTARTDEGRTGATASTETGAGGASASGSVDTGPRAPPASGTYEDPTASVPQGSGTASGSAAGASAPSDVKAHSDDQVLSGKISALSPQSMTVTTDAGEQRTLHLVPQTSLTVNGREDAQTSDLSEGLPVRASYNTVGDQDVAVDVRAGTSATDASGQDGVGLTPGTSTGAGKGDASSGSVRNPADSPNETSRRR